MRYHKSDISMPRYLSKSRFKIGLDCPSKLFYTGKTQYPDKSEADFFCALAEGIFHLGALAKCNYPEGIEGNDHDYDISLWITDELLANKVVVIFDGAFRYINLSVRAEITEKENYTKFYRLGMNRT